MLRIRPYHIRSLLFQNRLCNVSTIYIATTLHYTSLSTEIFISYFLFYSFSLLQYNCSLINLMRLSMLCCVTIPGEYNKGIVFFNSILKDSIHHVWFRREMAYYYIYRENKSLKTYNYDDDLHLKLKYGMSQHDSFVIPNGTEYTSYKKLAKEIESIERSQLGSIDKRSKEEIEEDRAEGYDVLSSTLPVTEGEEFNKAKQLIEEEEIAQNNRIEYLLKATGGIAKLIQLDHPGFLPNQRQHRQFGLAVLQLAQSLNEHIALRYDGGNKVCVVGYMKVLSERVLFPLCKCYCINALKSIVI